MELVTPRNRFSFLDHPLFPAILLYILGKYAWKPILAAIKEREESIEGALFKGRSIKRRNSPLDHRERGPAETGPCRT